MLKVPLGFRSAQLTRRFKTIVAIASLLCGACFMYAFSSGSASEMATGSQNIRRMNVEYSHVPVLTTSDHRYSDLLISQPDALYSLSDVLHLMLLFGPSVPIADGTSGDKQPILEIVCNDRKGQQFMGDRHLSETRWGIRFATPEFNHGTPNSRAVEAHQHQTLATLGAVGVKLTHKLSVNGQSVQLSQVLDDLVANFDIQARELEWTTLALLAYRDSLPSCCWENRFHEKFDFNDIVIEMMNRPLHNASCGATHRISALLAVLSAAKIDSCVLRDTCSSQLFDHLANLSESLRLSQRADGTWSPNWYSQTAPLPFGVWSTVSDHESQMLVTGHILEIWPCFPEPFAPPKCAITMAGTWIATALRNTPKADLRAKLCPNTHAIIACARLGFYPEVLDEEK